MKPFYKILKEDVRSRDWKAIDSKLLIKQVEQNKDLVDDYLRVIITATTFAEMEIRRNIYSELNGIPLTITLKELEENNYFLTNEKYFKELFNQAPLIVKNYKNPPISIKNDLLTWQKMNPKKLMFEILFGNIVINSKVSELVDNYIYYENHHFEKLRVFFAKSIAYSDVGKPGGRLNMKVAYDYAYLDRIYFLKEAFFSIKNNSLNWKTEAIRDSDKLRIYLALPDAEILSSEHLDQSCEIVKSKIQTLINADATIKDKLKRTFNWDKPHPNNLYSTKQNVIDTIELLTKYRIKEVNQFFKDLLEHHKLTYEPQG